MASKLRRSLDVKELGEFWLEYTRIGLDRAMEARKNIPESHIYDVRLRDMMASPMTVLEDIYSHFGLTNEQVRETLKTYNERFGV
jgi:hypothetical protein